MTDRPPLQRDQRGRTVTAVLGPTNTGKTHLAIERLVAHRNGMIGLPLRLLAREVYGRLVARLGPEPVALITGEEKILPPNARYYVATVEAMPLDLTLEFVAIDEVQLAADLERGRVFTDRILNLRGDHETLLLGALTARALLEKLLPGINVITRPRMSVLQYAGEKKITRLPPRSAVVAFSSNEVYSIAELIRRQRGGAAIVMGALSPRTRNAQVELFQSGDVEFLIATDAIGMGLNLDVDHVAFASSRKFDGYQHRALSAGELGQIAGRAGRHTRDGTFGVTGQVPPFPDELVEALETHAFPAAKVFQWRNHALDFSSVGNLRASLDEPAQEQGLTKAPPAEDQKALEYAAKTPEVVDMASDAAAVRRLWDVCQVPDYRKIAPANHADLLLTLYGFLMQGEGVIPDDWIARQVRYADRTDGDIDTLSNRIAHVRTWTFVANRNDWLANPGEWRQTTREVEDRLSDALHERLMQRFVDRRTSVLMKRLRENTMLEAEVNDSGDVIVEGQHVGALHGFRFQADASTGDPRDQKALRSAAAKALAKEMERRAEKVAAAPDATFTLSSDAGVRWQGALIAKVSAGEDVLRPNIVLLADETLQPAARERVEGRLNQWLAAHVGNLLKPLFDLREGEGLEAAARGLAYRIAEGLGSVDRSAVAEEAKALDQTARAGLRGLGVRFGAYHIFVPLLLKPAPSQLIAMLWALKNADLDVHGLTEIPQLSASGRTSIAHDPDVPMELYRVVGFRVCGPRAVRIDILERLADQIRPLVSWRPGPEAGDPPPGAVPQGGAFLVTVAMTSLLGCSGEDFAAVLKSLGYRVDRHEANEAEKKALAEALMVRAKGGKKSVPPPAAKRAEKAAADGADHAPADSEALAALSPDTPAPAPSEEAVTPADSDAGAGADDAPALEGIAADALIEPVATSHDSVVTPEAAVSDSVAAEDVPAQPEQAEPLEAAPLTPITDAVPPAVDEPASAIQSDAAEGTDAEQVPVVEAASAPEPSSEAVSPSETPVEGEPAAEPDADASEAPAADVEAAEAPAQEAEADAPVIVEVWRVPRHHRPGAGDRPRRGQNRDQDGRRGEQSRGRGPRRAAQSAPASNPGQAVASTAAEGASPQGTNPSGGAEAGRGPVSPGARGDHQERNRSGGKGKKRGKGHREQNPRPPHREQPKRQKEVDPDSPFAKLAALKLQLEKGGDDR